LNIYEGLSWLDEDLDKFSPEHQKAYDHALPIYQRTRAIYDTLKQVEYPEGTDLFPWIKQGPPIVVKMINYNHLDQTITITDQKPTRRDAPTLRSFKENTFLLHKLYHVSNMQDLFIGDPPASKGPASRDGKRSSASAGLGYCIVCAKPGETTSETTARKYYCPTMPAITESPEEEQRLGSCERCYMLRRPCVWAIPYWTAVDNARFRFIRTPPLDKRGVQYIEGPSDAIAAGPIKEEEERKKSNKAPIWE
jgi:hypothetical protein